MLAKQGQKGSPHGLASRSRLFIRLCWEARSGRLRLLSGRQFVAQLPGFPLQALQHTLLVRLFVLLLPLRHVLLPVHEHLVEDPRQLVRRRRYRLGHSPPGCYPPEERPQSALRGYPGRNQVNQATFLTFFGY